MAMKTTQSKRRIVHMPDALWNEAKQTAESLDLSISQLLSRLVVETAPLIRPNSLLGLPLTQGNSDESHRAA